MTKCYANTTVILSIYVRVRAPNTARQAPCRGASLARGSARPGHYLHAKQPPPTQRSAAPMMAMAHSVPRTVTHKDPLPGQKAAVSAGNLKNCHKEWICVFALQ